MTVKVHINIREGRPISVIGEAVFLWKEEDERNEQNNGKERVYLKFDTKNPDLYSKVKNSLLSYPGDTQVVIKCSSSDRVFAFQQNVKINNHLTNELSGIIGSENVVVK